MAGLANLLLEHVWSSFQSRERLKAEIVVLRHQLNILRRKAPQRPRLAGSDRALFAWMHRFFPSIAGAPMERSSRGGFVRWVFGTAP
jgi:hypothetical protein